MWKFDFFPPETRLEVLKFLDRPMLTRLETISSSLHTFIQQHLAHSPHVQLFQVRFGNFDDGQWETIKICILVSLELHSRLQLSTSTKIEEIIEISMAECEQWLGAPYLRTRAAIVHFSSITNPNKKPDDGEASFRHLMRYNHLWQGKHLQIVLPKRWHPPIMQMEKLYENANTAHCLIEKMPSPIFAATIGIAQIFIDRLTLFAPLVKGQYSVDNIMRWLIRPHHELWTNKFMCPCEQTNERTLFLADIKRRDHAFVEELLESVKKQFYSSTCQCTFGIRLSFGREKGNGIYEWRSNLLMPPSTFQNAIGEQLQIGLRLFGGKIEIFRSSLINC